MRQPVRSMQGSRKKCYSSLPSIVSGTLSFVVRKRNHHAVLSLALIASAIIVPRIVSSQTYPLNLSRDLLQNTHNRTALTLPNAFPSHEYNPSVIIASIHQGYGTHFINLHCGTPPQRQTLIIDTGSDVTGFVCRGCRKCGQQHNYFDPELSSTYQELSCDECLHGKCVKNMRNAPGHCRMEASYREGSGWKAKEASDICHIGEWNADLVLKKQQSGLSTGKDVHDSDRSLATVENKRFPLKFACQTSVSGAFQSQLEDGIVGLEYSSASLWRQMYNAGAIQQRTFALCFGRSLKPSTDGTALAGVLTLGGVEHQLHTTPMVMAQGPPESSKSEYFYVTVRKVYLKEGEWDWSASNSNSTIRVYQLDISEEDLNEEEVIIDSGATDTYFTKRLEAPFQKVWMQLTGHRFDRKYEPKITKEELDRLPTMLFQLRGVEDYNLQVANGQHTSFIPGLAGSLDPDHPHDVLVSVPPSHYYEYNPHTNRYYSRFHFDPGYDSAFGSSTMLGHDILFDIENRRIGWAESACDYEALIVATATKSDAASRDVRNVVDKASGPRDSQKQPRIPPSPASITKVEPDDFFIEMSVQANTSVSSASTGAAKSRLFEAVKAEIRGPCSALACRFLWIVFALPLLLLFCLMSYLFKAGLGSRKRRRSDKFSLLKPVLSDLDDEKSGREPKNNHISGSASRSFDEGDDASGANQRGIVLRLNSVTRRYRG